MPSDPVFILLFVVATVVAIAVQRLAIPYTVALVFTGLVLGWLHAIEAPHLTCYVRSFFVKLISAFSTRETGHPAFAFSVISSNFAASIPGTFPFRSR